MLNPPVWLVLSYCVVGPCEESQLRGDGFVTSFTLNFFCLFPVTLHAFVLFFFFPFSPLPFGVCSGKGSSRISLLCLRGVEAAKAPAEPSAVRVWMPKLMLA